MQNTNPLPDAPLSFREWWDEVGTENVITICKELGVGIEYLRFVRYRLKRPHYDLANKIIEAAKRNTPGFVPSLELMMEPIPPRIPNPQFPRRIQPSKAFLAHQEAAFQQDTGPLAATSNGQD
jgi:hypothetical protein